MKMTPTSSKYCAIGTIAATVFLSACHAETTMATSAAISQQASEMVLGYLHLPAKSRFAMGATIVQRTEFGFQKSVGEHGVFATHIQSGWAMGIPNADSPTKTVAAMTTKPEVHNGAVVAYFTGAGLPNDQIAYVNAHATVHTTSVGGNTDPSAPIFDWYSTVISRQINDIPVAESFAWAIINANNDVVEESVYWPDIPASAVAEAMALNATVTETLSTKAYLAKLPGTFAPGQVMIHHTPCVGGATEAKATYDVTQKGRMGQTRHFDSTGAEIVLAAESVPVGPNSGPKP